MFKVAGCLLLALLPDKLAPVFQASRRSCFASGRQMNPLEFILATLPTVTTPPGGSTPLKLKSIVGDAKVIVCVSYAQRIWPKLDWLLFQQTAIYRTGKKTTPLAIRSPA